MNVLNFFSGRKEQQIWQTSHDDSSVAQYRSSKASGEEAGITRGWCHQSPLINKT